MTPCYIGRVMPLGKTHRKINLWFLPAAVADMARIAADAIKPDRLFR